MFDLRKQKNPRVRSGIMMKSNLYNGFVLVDILLSLLIRARSLPLRLGLLIFRPVTMQCKGLLIIPRRRVFVGIRGFDVES